MDVLVPSLRFEIEDVLLQQPADRRAFGQPQRQPGAHFLADGEQLELLAEAAVIATLGILEPREILV